MAPKSLKPMTGNVNPNKKGNLTTEEWNTLMGLVRRINPEPPQASQSSASVEEPRGSGNPPPERAELAPTPEVFGAYSSPEIEEVDSVHSFSGEEGDEAPGGVQIPVYADRRVPLPTGVDSWEQFDSTLVTMPKYKHLNACFGQLITMAQINREAHNYCSMLYGKYAQRVLLPTVDMGTGQFVVVRQPKCQAEDFAWYMASVKFNQMPFVGSTEQGGYQRQFVHSPN